MLAAVPAKLAAAGIECLSGAAADGFVAFTVPPAQQKDAVAAAFEAVSMP